MPQLPLFAPDRSQKFTAGRKKERMVPVVGVFESRESAQQGAAALGAAGIAKKYLTILTPDSSQRDPSMQSVPQTQGEQPGMIKAMGAVAGGAVGMGLGEVLASLLVPGVGPILAIGVAGGALLGAIGGGAVGGALENSAFSGLPEEELYVYQDALRRGRTVVVAMAEDQTQAQAARNALAGAGAESIDRAREMWWVGLRDVEKEHYESTPGRNFVADEPAYRRGFEAGLRSGQNRPSPEAGEQNQPPDAGSPVSQEQEAFRWGYERGRAYAQETRSRSKSA
jgi:hypothetical protein